MLNTGAEEEEVEEEEEEEEEEEDEEESSGEVEKMLNGYHHPHWGRRRPLPRPLNVVIFSAAEHHPSHSHRNCSELMGLEGPTHRPFV